MIKLSVFQDKWAATFTELKADLMAHASDIIVDIEHIGSTAISGAEAKDIIDVQIAVKSFEQINALRLILEPMHFEYISTIMQDHVPFHEFNYFNPDWEKRFFKGIYKGQEVNAHVRLKTNPNWHFAINFRDYLTSNEHARYAFMQFKKRLAHSQVSRDNYCLIKDSVIDIISLLFNQDDE